ncbi:MAG: glycosyltransferase family 4 protein [Alphaproteobacteria bacterium]|nr:glycosyltransferase family 4 protein [Alphaproteobacteria bacterium]MCB9929158.1 glycosyltransferase family 4 protein [Alphaproteobacteria bacterium]
MKILYHHRTQAADGQYVHISELTEALEALGHEIVMVGPGGNEKRRMDAGTDSGPGLRERLPAWLYELLEFGYSAVAFWKLWRAWRRHRPDVLYERYNIYCLSGTWLRWLTGLPMALEVNAPLFEERSTHGDLTLKGLARWTEVTAWRAADVCLPVTNVLADYVRAARVPEERIRIIPNGAGAPFLDGSADGASVRDRHGLEGRLVLGFTGFVRPWHGIDKVIDLLAGDRLPPEAHLLMVGDGPARPDLEAQAQRLGVTDRVTFTGVVQRDAVPHYVAAFDIALQPHVVAYASPLKLIEYLALGRAIVAPDTRNIREILTDGEDGLLFAAGNTDAFAEAIVRLANDPALRQRLGGGALALLHRRNLTWRHNAERVVDLFRARLAHRR